MSKNLEITLKRSMIGANKKQRNTINSLGLRSVNDVVVKEDSPSVRGMVNIVSHLVTVKEID
ncbi:MAG TPA: 50S ribosomal protein L30 [Bacillota bacterium]|nr:50S ribosomal protein L30 [Bacillota bacterium]